MTMKTVDDAATATAETPAPIEIHRPTYSGAVVHEANKKGTLFWVDPSAVVVDGLDNDRQVDPYNAQRIKEKVRSEDVESIIQHGVMLPVIVNVRREGDKEETVVVEGRQRIRRARKANELIAAHNAGEKILKDYEGQTLELVSVPAVAEKPSEGVEALLKSIAANQGRVQDGPRALSQAATYLAAHGASTRQIANALGRDMQTVRDYLAIGNASAKVLSALDKGKIDTTAACRLATLPKDEQNAKLEELSEGGSKKVTKEAATRVAKEAKDKKKAAKKGKEKESKPRQVADKRSVSELRLVQLGLEKDLAEGDKRTREYADKLAALNAVNFVLGEAYSDHEGAQDLHKMLMQALKAGAKVKAQEAKAAQDAKKAGKSED
jgi:ParB family chromosome partitioning protein